MICVCLLFFFSFGLFFWAPCTIPDGVQHQTRDVDAVLSCVCCGVVWCLVWSVATLQRDTWLLLSLARAFFFFFFFLFFLFFEFLATLTFGALRRNHSVSKAFETIAKNARRPRVVSSVS